MLDEIQNLKKEIESLKDELSKVKDVQVGREEVIRLWGEHKQVRKEMMDNVKELSSCIHEVKNDVQSFRSSTKDLIEAFNALQGVVKVVLWVGKVMKPLAFIALAITGVVLYFQNIDFTQFLPKGK